MLILIGCPQDQSSFQEENNRLKKQEKKNESFIKSLQEGNKVLREQIDKLNQDARADKDAYEKELNRVKTEMSRLADNPKKENARLQSLEKENQKLRGEGKWLRTQRDKMRKSLMIQPIGGQAFELSQSFASIPSIVQETLTKNGYTILSTMQSDTKAIFITDRKTSLPPSLELSGFRNQYYVMVEKSKTNKTLIWIRAEFEKVSHKGHIFSAPDSEVAETEKALLNEIIQSLSRKSSLSFNHS